MGKSGKADTPVHGDTISTSDTTLPADNEAADRAHAERIEADLALLRDILDYHGRHLITWSYTPTQRESEALARLGMTPRPSNDPVVRQRRRMQALRHIECARTILSTLLLAIRENRHGTWLQLELAQKSLVKSLFSGTDKKLAVLAVLDILRDARQELSKIRGFGHLAPGWRDFDTKGGRKKSKAPRQGAPMDMETADRVRTIAADLISDLASIDDRFSNVEVDRMVELLQIDNTLERFAGYLVSECGALGYPVTTTKEREKLIKNFEEVRRADEREKQRGEDSPEEQ